MSARWTIVAVLGCLVAGVALLLVAVDAVRWQETMASDDARYRAVPATEGLWSPTQIAPFGLAGRALGVSDDTAYRLAVRPARLSRPDFAISDPNLVIARNEATARLTQVVEDDPDRLRRSAAANVLGALAYAEARNDYENRQALLETATDRFREAVALDAQNADAKYSLELVLSVVSALEAAEIAGGVNPSPGGRGARGAGAADPGSGY